MKRKIMKIHFGKFMKLIGTAFVFTFILLNISSVQAQRGKLTKQEMEQAARNINCSDCASVGEVLEAAATLTTATTQFIGQQVVDTYYEKGLAWVSKSAIVGTIGGVAVGLIQPSDLAGPELDNRPVPTPTPTPTQNNRTMKVCYYNNAGQYICN
jgi:hypothetical protein